MSKAKQKFVKIAIERISRTDLICVACGQFRTEWAIVLPGISMEDFEPVAGLHVRCVEKLHVRHSRKSKDGETAS